MTLERREGSMTRSPVGLLGGRQTRSSTGLRGGTTASERLQQWLSRSANSIRSLPPPSASHSLTASQVNTAESGMTVEHGTRLGRPTKASLLRMTSCPVAYVEPDYREMVRRRKQFAQRYKSVSAHAIQCGSLPNGESLHSFLTGARYNSSHHMDTRSLERLGLYIPRGDASRTFVNPAGTIPPSPAIYGLRHCSRGPRVSDTCTLMHASSRHTISDPGIYGCTLDTRLRHVVNSTMSIDKEIEQVFGPDQGSSGSDSLSLEAQFEGNSKGSDHQLAIDRDTKESGGKQKEESVTSSVSILNSNCSEEVTSDLEGSQGFEVVTVVLSSNEGENATDNRPTTSDSLTPISPSGTPKTGDEFETAEVAANKLENGDAQSSTEICLDARQTEDPESLDLISPTAQQIADDILKECQSSTSLSRSSSSNTAGSGAANQRQRKEDGDIMTVDRCLQTSFVETSQLQPDVSIKGVNLPLSGTGNCHHTDTTNQPPSASSLQLASASGKSSCIFIDLTSLQAAVDQDQD